MISRRGIARRLQALAAVGHPDEDVAEWLGVDVPMLTLAQQETGPAGDVAVAAVEAVFEREASRPGRSWGTQVRARKAGWVTWLAWDDIDHDHEPVGVRPEPRPRFPGGPPRGARVADFRALAPAGAVSAEDAAKELVLSWWENGARVAEIAAALRCSERRVLMFLQRLRSASTT